MDNLGVIMQGVDGGPAYLFFRRMSYFMINYSVSVPFTELEGTKSYL